MSGPTIATSFAPLDPERLATWQRYIRDDRIFFPTHVGLVVEELRTGYSRMRLPLRPEVTQARGIMHGGAIATLVDTVAVPAVGTWYDHQPDMVTISMTVNFVGTVAGEDAIGEGWVESGGRSVAFVRSEVRAASGSLVATGSLVYRVRQRS